jgi:hypothetical protein
MSRALHAALVSGLFLLAACDPADVAVRSVQRQEAARSVRGNDHYVGIRGKKKTPTGLAFLQAPPETWAPFDVSIHMGLFDPARTSTADGVIQCLEIDDVGFSLFFDVCATYDAAQAGWNLAAFYGGPSQTPLPGALFVAGAEFELRAATDGATLHFYGRPFGSQTWSEVASMAYPVVTVPLHAAFGVNFLAKGTEIGFDDPSFSSGPPVGPVTTERMVAASANDAMLAGLAAYQALDGDVPDFATAGAALGDALLAIGDAQTGAAALGTRAGKKAAKQFKKAAKKLGAAAKHTAAQKAPRALKDLEKAAKSYGKGVLGIVPQPPTHFP